jgi:ABC-type multidrug transport system ATPase subunit
MHMLVLSGIEYAWPEATKIGPISFDAKKGEIVGVFGRSGTGKTTLFRLLSGELSALAGTLEYKSAGARVYHDQVQKVVPWLSAKQNALLSLTSEDQNDKDQLVELLFEITGIAEFLDRDATRLSGGQKARVTLVRSLVANSDLLILDEPFSGVDVPTQDRIIDRLRELVAGKLTFFTAHDPAPMIQLCSRILVLKQIGSSVTMVEHRFSRPEFSELSPIERKASATFVEEVQSLTRLVYD